MVKVTHLELCKRQILDYSSKCHKHKPESVLENKTDFWDFKIQTDHPILAKRIGLIIQLRARTNIRWLAFRRTICIVLPRCFYVENKLSKIIGNSITVHTLKQFSYKIWNKKLISFIRYLHKIFTKIQYILYFVNFSYQNVYSNFFFLPQNS